MCEKSVQSSEAYLEPSQTCYRGASILRHIKTELHMRHIRQNLKSNIHMHTVYPMIFI